MPKQLLDAPVVDIVEIIQEPLQVYLGEFGDDCLRGDFFPDMLRDLSQPVVVASFLRSQVILIGIGRFVECRVIQAGLFAQLEGYIVNIQVSGPVTAIS